MGRRSNWELFLEVIGFGLGADCSADVVAHMQELSEDMGTNETAGAGDEDERLFRGHDGRSESKAGGDSGVGREPRRRPFSRFSGVDSAGMTPIPTVAAAFQLSLRTPTR
jgi:hypothetical protein